MKIKNILIIGTGKIILEDIAGYELYEQDTRYEELPNITFNRGVVISEKSDTAKIKKVLIYA